MEERHLDGCRRVEAMCLAQRALFHFDLFACLYTGGGGSHHGPGMKIRDQLRGSFLSFYHMVAW